MGVLVAVDAVVMRAMAEGLFPPPPPDITAWCEQNVEFDGRSPFPGPFRIERFPFLRDIHAVLSPEHPARDVTVMGSAQWGKTVSIIQPVLGAWFAYAAVDALVVHPTTAAATEWVKNKWLPMRRQVQALRDIFGDGRGENSDNTFNQETLARNGSLKVASAGSPADLTGTSRRLVILDDLAKFDMTDKGDPEALAVSRASAFEDAKILRVSTPLVRGTCRISRAYARSDQREYHVPCPHCGHMAPLTWENFKANIDPERLAAAHFTCDACGCVIGHGDKIRMLQGGRWVARNPRGDHPGFFLWRAYSPMRDWASIAAEYAQVMGWTRIDTAVDTEEALQKGVEAATEQTFFNDVLGLPYAIASDAPDWEALRDRTENAAEADVLPRSVLPACGFILAAGVDCQDDRMEVQIVAFLRDRRRHVVDYRVIPHHVGDEAGRAALDALLKAEWRTTLGLRVGIDMLAIDMGTFTDDTWTFAKRHPWDRVILVKGSGGQHGPVLQPMRFERRNDGKAKRAQKRAFMLNVSSVKADFYGWLRKDDPAERGYVSFGRGLGDEYYRQLTSEVRVLERSGATGVVTSRWKLVEASRRNEGLDTMVYSEAAARRKGWGSLTDGQWDALDGERGAAPAQPQADLFDATVPVVVPEPETAQLPVTPPQGASWFGNAKGGSWF